MRKFLCLTALLAVLSCSGPLRKTARGFRTDGPVSRFEVVCYAPDIIQIVKSPLYGEADIAPGPSVVLEPGKVHFGLERPGNGLVRLTTDSLCVELDVEEAPSLSVVPTEPSSCGNSPRPFPIRKSTRASSWTGTRLFTAWASTAAAA